VAACKSSLFMKFDRDMTKISQLRSSNRGGEIVSCLCRCDGISRTVFIVSTLDECALRIGPGHFAGGSAGMLGLSLVALSIALLCQRIGGDMVVFAGAGKNHHNSITADCPQHLICERPPIDQLSSRSQAVVLCENMGSPPF